MTKRNDVIVKLKRKLELNVLGLFSVLMCAVVVTIVIYSKTTTIPTQFLHPMAEHSDGRMSEVLARFYSHKKKAAGDFQKVDESGRFYVYSAYIEPRYAILNLVYRYSYLPSAQCLIELIIEANFYEIHSKNVRETKQTRNTGL